MRQSGCVQASGGTVPVHDLRNRPRPPLSPRPAGPPLLGDYLSQPTSDGGLGLGTVITSALFLAVILGLVVYLGVTRKDVATPERTGRQAV
ncbi:hypothetical protein [Streptomyces sp. NPDC005209]|uniref:hypothetical protein n=1 Tax=Streptomyces sp. NPDC005209 TaxID=3156715 RepID=UPI0033A835EB